VITNIQATNKLPIQNVSNHQNHLYNPNQTRLSRPVKEPYRLQIKFSTIQENKNINNNQD
jgi:hypothetical protein